MKTNVYQFPGKAAQGEATTQKKTLTKEQREYAAAVSRQINAAYTNVLTKPVDALTSSSTSDVQLYGPYRMPIIVENGVTIHTAGQYIDKLRRARKYTQNCIELRCDELGLVVYVAPYSKVEDGVHKTGVRVVQYDHDSMQPTSHVIVKVNAVHDRLATILTSTYNHLNRQFNIAGIDPSAIMLKSNNPAFPDIPLIEKTK